MKSLSQYIFELSDETYLNLANKRKLQNKDISNILSHAYNMLSKSFFDDLLSYDWMKYVKNIPKEPKEYYIQLIFDDIMRSHYGGEKEQKIRNQIYDDLIALGKKYNRFIHGFVFSTKYSNEEPYVAIYIFDRKKYLKNIKSTSKLYHVTSSEQTIKKILSEGLTPQEANMEMYDYTYKCVFAFRSKSSARYYATKYLPNEYYLIEFEAGDNIYFNDKKMNNDEWNYDLDAVFTLSKIDKQNIISIVKIKNKKQVEEYYKRQ